MNHSIIRTILWTTVRAPKRIAAVFLSLSLFSVGSNAGELTIYSTTDADNLKVIGEAFSKAHPDIKVNWVRDSTGIMHARLMAEKDNPRADVLFAMAATSMLGMDELGMFVPYTPNGVDALDARYRDKNDPAHWTGIYAGPVRSASTPLKRRSTVCRSLRSGRT